VGAFAGWNPDLLLSGEMMVRLEDSRTFRVVLTPEQRRVKGWFVDAALRIPGRGHPELFSLSARLSHTRRKPFITRSLRPDTNTTRLERMNATAGGVVAALRLYTPEGALRTRLWGGARHGWVAPVFRDRVTRPYLASRLSAGVELQLWRRLDMGAELLLSMSDGSLRVTPSAALRIAEGISVAAEAPLFFGGAETELGEYGENGFIRLILGISF
jgi:hypothetical protein